ncbi:JAB domain-containing protein [Pseudomonas sp. Ant30-3]|uniref:JAB domain-containing protein n=1 Tax=Pseudomonas sp. Ant30-3 TaxID=1488328 RepID=UPI000B178784
MKYHKLRAGETSGTYVMESPVTEADILQMAQQLAMSRLSKGRALTEPKHVFSHLQTLLQYHEHEVFALLLLDTKPRVIGFRELFRGTLDGASVYPREVVKIALEHNAAAVIMVHFVARHKMAVMCPVFLCVRRRRHRRRSRISAQSQET